MTKTEQYELEAISYAQIPKLPEEVNENTPIWIYAIAKILTYNMLESYAIVRNVYGQTPDVIKVFSEGGIAEIKSLYPYKFLDKKYIPSFDKENSAKRFISKVYDVEKEKVAKLDKDTILRLVYNYCIKRQLLAEAEENARAEAKREQEARFAEIEKIRNQE